MCDTGLCHARQICEEPVSEKFSWSELLRQSEKLFRNCWDKLLDFYWRLWVKSIIPQNYNMYITDDYGYIFEMQFNLIWITLNTLHVFVMCLNLWKGV